MGQQDSRHALGWLLMVLGAVGAGPVALAQQPSHRPNVVFEAGFEDVRDGPFNDAEAARFLTQATFGARPEDIRALRRLGYSAWLDAQFAVAPSYQVPYLTWVAAQPAGHNAVHPAQRLESWYINALGLYDLMRGRS